MIRILYFARLRETLGTGSESIVLPQGVDNLDALRAHLIARGGAWSDELGANRAIRAAVNHDVAGGDTRIADGDEVAFFPPVTGG